MKLKKATFKKKFYSFSLRKYYKEEIRVYVKPPFLLYPVVHDYKDTLKLKCSKVIYQFTG